MHTKYSVEETEDKTAEAALLRKPGAVQCPKCQKNVFPTERYGGLLVCPECGTEPFEQKP